MIVGRMSRDDFDPTTLAFLGVVAVGLYVWQVGLKKAAEKAGGAAVDIITGAGTGAVSSVGDVFGLPSTNQVANDPRIARWILDHPNGGRLAASFYSTPIAIAQAMGYAKGTGTPAPAGTKIAEMYPPIPGVTDAPMIDAGRSGNYEWGSATDNSGILYGD